MNTKQTKKGESGSPKEFRGREKKTSFFCCAGEDEEKGMESIEESLPGDVLEHIFCFLTVPELLMASLVSKRWHKLKILVDEVATEGKPWNLLYRELSTCFFLFLFLFGQ